MRKGKWETGRVMQGAKTKTSYRRGGSRHGTAYGMEPVDPPAVVVRRHVG